ncbi:MAG: TPM domain-containing protein [Patescibacteria group bacterium]
MPTLLRRFLSRSAALTLTLLLGSASVYAAVALPPEGFVNDRANLLSEAYREALETELREYEQISGNEIALLAVPTSPEGSIEEFAVEVFEEWGIGKSDADNGLLLVIAKEDRKIRIEVGYGLESYITDGRAGRIIRDDMAPLFKEGEYDEGVAAAILRIKEHLSGAPAGAAEESSGDEYAPFIVLGFFFVQFVFGGLLHVMAKSKSVLLGGGLGIVLGLGIGFLVGLGSVGLIFALAFFGGIGTLFDWLVSNYASERVRKGESPFWGYGGGGSSSGDSGFGGFGGGFSGGGGASGGW